MACTVGDIGVVLVLFFRTPNTLAPRGDLRTGTAGREHASGAEKVGKHMSTTQHALFSHPDTSRPEDVSAPRRDEQRSYTDLFREPVAVPPQNAGSDS